MTVEVEKGAFDKKLPVVAAENPTVRIERRLFQVFHNILLVNFIRLEFYFRFHFLFLGVLGFENCSAGDVGFLKAGLRPPTFSYTGKRSGDAGYLQATCVPAHCAPNAGCVLRKTRILKPQAPKLTIEFTQNLF